VSRRLGWITEQADLDAAFAILIDTVGGDGVDRCPETGEVWQYMGSAQRTDIEGASWKHSFRHRSWPGHGTPYQRHVVEVYAPKGWAPAKAVAD